MESKLYVSLLSIFPCLVLHQFFFFFFGLLLGVSIFSFMSSREASIMAKTMQVSTNLGDSRVSQNKISWTCNPQFKEDVLKNLHGKNPPTTQNSEGKGKAPIFGFLEVSNEKKITSWYHTQSWDFFLSSIGGKYILHQNCYWYGILVVSFNAMPFVLGKQRNHLTIDFFPFTYCNWPLVHDDGYAKCVCCEGL